MPFIILNSNGPGNELTAKESQRDILTNTHIPLAPSSSPQLIHRSWNRPRNVHFHYGLCQVVMRLRNNALKKGSSEKGRGNF